MGDLIEKLKVLEAGFREVTTRPPTCQSMIEFIRGLLSTLSVADGTQKRHASREGQEAIESAITRDMQERNQTIEFEP